MIMNTITVQPKESTMKKISLTLALIALLSFANTATAQEKVKKEVTKEVKKEVKKEVNVEKVNGEKVLTIKTTEDGKTTTQVYKGEEADKKLEELSQHKSETKKTTVIGEDGKKHTKIEKKVIIKKE
jgi:Na+-translocating ferredoxin:NAD+ oxidoreductase RnfG subunit